MIWTTLAHHIDLEWLHEAYRRTRKDGAAGIDGVRAREYEAALEANLTELLEQFKTGSYRAPAVRRVHIPKEGAQNKTRPIGIPTLSDKILQRAVLMVLEPIYEQDFLDCSYGFRPGRGAHQALEALWKGLKHAAINRKLRGHYAYYGVTGNYRALNRYRRLAERTWRVWLNRRSQRARMTWERYKQLLRRYPLLPPRIVHSIYPRAAKP
jgi:hypothetical protein